MRHPVFLRWMLEIRTQGLEEWSLKIEVGKEVECLLDRLKAHFSQSNPVTDEQRAKHRSELLKQKGLKEGDVPEAMLNAATSMQLVEPIALLPCMAKYRYVGVTAYVDDAGSFKQLPINERATDIALRCGMSSTVILGDAFLARVKESDEEFERMDFTLSDISSDARWMKNASKHQEEKITRPTAQEVIKKLTSNPKECATSPSDHSRERGNAAYRRGSYAEAVKEYTTCIAEDAESVLAYSNRSMAHLQLKNYTAALLDAEAALKMDDGCVKATYRKGLALDGLNRQEEAIEAYNHVIRLQPENAAAMQKLNERT